MFSSLQFVKNDRNIPQSLSKMQPNELLHIFKLNLTHEEFLKFLQILRDLKTNVINKVESKQCIVELIQNEYPLLLSVFIQYLENRGE